MVAGFLPPVDGSPDGFRAADPRSDFEGLVPGMAVPVRVRFLAARAVVFVLRRGVFAAAATFSSVPLPGDLRVVEGFADTDSAAMCAVAARAAPSSSPARRPDLRSDVRAVLPVVATAVSGGIGVHEEAAESSRSGSHGQAPIRDDERFAPRVRRCDGPKSPVRPVPPAVRGSASRDRIRVPGVNGPPDRKPRSGRCGARLPVRDPRPA